MNKFRIQNSDDACGRGRSFDFAQDDNGGDAQDDNEWNAQDDNGGNAQDDREAGMIQARMDWKKMVLEMDGHANYAPKGQDIVCAGVSALSFALVNALDKIDHESGMAQMKSIADGEGHMRIRARVCWENLSVIRACFLVTVTGLKMLAEQYPEYIKVEEE